MNEPEREILWEPSSGRIQKSVICKFINFLKIKEVVDYTSLYSYSISHPENFWKRFLQFSNLIYYSDSSENDGIGQIITNSGSIIEARFFPELSLNYAENLLRGNDDKLALIFRGEAKKREVLTYEVLRRKVSAVAKFLTNQGVNKGDRVAGVVANCPEAIIAMLATAAIGAVWTSASPDFGVQGLIDRFEQVQPKVLFCSDGYYYKGKIFSIEDKVEKLVELLQVPVVVCPYIELDNYLNGISKSLISDLYKSSEDYINFTPVNFNDPLFIMYSSGTTGKPKCITHGVGGTLLEHIKEHRLHTDLTADDVFFYATTCGWMMWNWLVSGLATGSTLVLYDGFPMENDGKILWDVVEEEEVTIFGTSAAYLSLIEKEKLSPKSTHNLKSLKTILSTGSVLLPESYDYVYREIKSDICLSSISGGTDIIGCFGLGAPDQPVRRGQLQARSLGYAVEVYDENANSLVNQSGELVCTAAFPSRPIGFWNDPEDLKYRQAYYEKFPGVWHHGDFVKLTDQGTLIFYGRSDATLNPGGVRIGSAEIYRELEQIEFIKQSVVIGQVKDGIERILLFVVPRTEEPVSEVKKKVVIETLKKNLSPRHVPAIIFSVRDTPVTRSGKLSELTVKNIFAGKEPTNTEALSNPSCLDEYKELFKKLDK